MSRKKALHVYFPGLPGRIRKIRGELTQKAFSVLIGVSQGTINKYETGIASPGGFVLNKIANYGGMTEEWLLHGDPTAPQLTETAPEIYDTTPLTPIVETALTEVIAAVEYYFSRNRLKRRPIQKARLIIRLYQHYAETREKPDDILIKGNLPLAD